MKTCFSRLSPAATAAGFLLFLTGCLPDSKGPSAAEIEAVRQADEAQRALEETRAAYDWQAAEVEKRSAELASQLAAMESELQQRKDAEMQERLEALRVENERLRQEGERARLESERITRQVEEIRRATPVTMPVAGGYSGADVMFRERLRPYGDWVSVNGYGDCWRPSLGRHPDWRPYVDGRWSWSDQGWLWVSNEPFGWATYHYGRWVRVARYGWVWVPGTEWAPAWVAWRSGGSHVGWAPLPPEPAGYAWSAVGADCESRYRIQPTQYVFVPVTRFVAPTYVNVQVSQTQVTQVWQQTVNVTNLVRLDRDGGRPGGGHRDGGVFGQSGGPDREWIHRECRTGVPTTRARLADGSLIEARLTPEMRAGPRSVPQVVQQPPVEAVRNVPEIDRPRRAGDVPELIRGGDRLTQGESPRGDTPRQLPDVGLGRPQGQGIPSSIAVPPSPEPNGRIVAAEPIQGMVEEPPHRESIRRDDSPVRGRGLGERLRNALGAIGLGPTAADDAPADPNTQPEVVAETSSPPVAANPIDTGAPPMGETVIPGDATLVRPETTSSVPEAVSPEFKRGQAAGGEGRRGGGIRNEEPALSTTPVSPQPVPQEIPPAVSKGSAGERAEQRIGAGESVQGQVMAEEAARQQAMVAQQTAAAEEAARQAAEEQLRRQQEMDAQRAAEEAARQAAEEQMRQQQAMEAQRAAEEAARQAAEEQMRQQQEMEAQRAAEEAARRAAEEQVRQQQEMEAKRAAEEAARRAAEEQMRQQQEMEAQRAAEEAARRAAEEQMRRQQEMEAQRAAEEAARRAAEEQMRRQQEMEAQRAAEEAARRAAEEQMRRQAEEAQRQAQEAARRAAEEAARQQQQSAGQ